MTNVYRKTKTVVEHTIVIPAPEPYGATAADFGVALTWATQTAESLGIDTNTDDWCRIFPWDDEIRVVVCEEKEEKQ